jgi:hypothetical protein
MLHKRELKTEEAETVLVSIDLEPVGRGSVVRLDLDGDHVELTPQEALILSVHLSETAAVAQKLVDALGFVEG